MPTPTRREFRVPGLNEPISHYTDAVSFGDLLFVSGIGPLAEDGSLVGPDDPAEQSRQIFRNLDRVLRAAGATPADVLKVTVYLTGIMDRETINLRDRSSSAPPDGQHARRGEQARRPGHAGGDRGGGRSPAVTARRVTAGGGK
jgi:enamine deaminase RidA (YjgF/YER057c/UK114 family)